MEATNNTPDVIIITQRHIKVTTSHDTINVINAHKFVVVHKCDFEINDQLFSTNEGYHKKELNIFSYSPENVFMFDENKTVKYIDPVKYSLEINKDSMYITFQSNDHHYTDGYNECGCITMDRCTGSDIFKIMLNC